MRDPEVNTFLPWFPLTSLNEARQFLSERYLSVPPNTGEYHYTICLRTRPDELIGYLNISGGESHDLGYGLQKAFWGQGIATEAAQAVVDHLRTSGIPFLTATHDIRNPGSGAVMRKIGMTYRYSYQEFWLPKQQQVIFRMYQLDLDGQVHPTYRAYWDKWPVHWVETGL